MKPSRRTSRSTTAVLTVVALAALAGCSSSGDISKSDGETYIKHVRDFIPSAKAYDDDSLLNMAKNVCALGDADEGVGVLDNYRDLDPEDYRPLAISALTYACPDKS